MGNNDFRIDLVISRGIESEVVTIYREAEAGETLADIVREVYEAFNVGLMEIEGGFDLV